MAGKRGHLTPMPPQPEDRSWAAHAEALKREKPAQFAIVFALLAFLATLAGWVAVLIAPGGDIRGKPMFWLLAAPLIIWLWNVQSLAAWTVRTVWLVLLLAPCLSVAALVLALEMRQAALLEDGREYLDTPLAMSVILGLTTAFAVAGLVALRRSSLPGGTRPVAYIAPGTPVPGARTLAPAATNMLMLGSLPFSGTLINGIFFAIVAMMEPVGPGGTIWPTALVAVLMLTVATLVFRGGFRLARRRPGAAADLRRGWRLGIGCTIAAVAALWAWPSSSPRSSGSVASWFRSPLRPPGAGAAPCGTYRILPGSVDGEPAGPPSGDGPAAITAYGTCRRSRHEAEQGARRTGRRQGGCARAEQYERDARGR